MAIRNASKALVVSEDKILANRYVSQEGEVYYTLPGGGQHVLETMEEAAIREVLEETGYRVKVVRFAALAEEIDDSLEGGEYSEYSHRIIHIFQAELMDAQAVEPLKMDFQQTESVWLGIEEADREKFYPEQLCGRISQIVRSGEILYLGFVRSKE